MIISTNMTAKRRFTLWEVTIMFHCLSLLLIEVDVNAVSPCINRVELLQGLLISSGLENYINATSFISPYLPSEARSSGMGWCSDDLTCNKAGSQFIEIDFGAEVIIEAVAILRVGGSFITHYSVEYAGSDRARDYHCISEQTTNESVFNRSRICDLNTEPSNFTNPVVARYIRIIPIQWVGASICLKIELFGCTIKECRNANTLLPDTISVSSSMSTANQVLDLPNYWCGASDPVLQTAAVRLRFVQSVYLTQLQVRSNSVTFNVFLHANDTLYRNIMGFNNFRLPFNIRMVLPLWLPINTTQLEFSLSPNTLSQVCFAVELTGCLSSNVIDHTEGATMSSMRADNIGTCNRPNPIPASSESLTISTSSERAITDTNTASVYQSTSVIIIQSTSFVTVTNTVKVTASAMVQQCEVSSDSDDDCNIIAIVVPTVLVIIALVVIVCINIIVVIKMMKRRKDVITSVNKQATYVAENESQDSAKETTNENRNIIKMTSLSSYKGNELSTTDLNDCVYSDDSRREFVNPEYVTADEQQVTVISGVTTTVKDDPALTYNPAYCCINNSDPPLSDNPAYITIKDGSPPPTDSDTAIDQIYI